jgi:hypothetical protein
MSKFGLFRRWAVAPFLASMVIVMGAIAATASYAPSHRQLSVQVQVLAPHGVYAHAIAAYVVVHGRSWAHTRRPANGEPFTKTATARFATTESFAAEGDQLPLFIQTPYELATQSSDAAALAARDEVLRGATLYKGGSASSLPPDESQFFALENPESPGYAARYGIPPKNLPFDWWPRDA